MATKNDEAGVELLTTSLYGKIGCIAPELMRERLRDYLMTAWMRGKRAGLNGEPMNEPATEQAGKAGGGS